mgnify:CR=1 FL=1
MASGSKLRHRSKKRAQQERHYTIQRGLFLENNPICQVKGCRSQSTEIHHKKGRIGDLLTDVRFFLAVCRSHHNYIEHNPAEAKEHGYSLSRLTNEL